MKGIHCLLLSFLLIASGVFAQEKEHSAKEAFQLTWLPSQLLQNELLFSFRPFSDRQRAWEFSAGYRFSGHKPILAPEPHGLYGSYLNQQAAQSYYDAVYLSAARVFRINETSYSSVELFERYWWARNAHVDFSNVEKTSQDIDAIRNEDISVTGLKFLLGSRRHLARIGEHTQLMMNLYTGLGCRLKYYYFQNKQGTRAGVDASGTEEQYWRGALSFQMGLKIGFVRLRTAH